MADMTSATARPLRDITIACNGTRGDMQPYLALSVGLVKAGYNVTVITNAGYQKMIESFGVRCLELFPNSEKLMQEDPTCKEAMNSGDLSKFIKFVSDQSAEGAKFIRDSVNHFLKAKVDLCVSGTLTEYLGYVTKYRLKIPTVAVTTSTISPTSQRAMLGLPTLPFRLHNYILEAIMKSGVKGFPPLDDEIQQSFKLEPIGDIIDGSTIVQRFREGPTEPMFVMQSIHFREILTPGLSSMISHTGQCIISDDAQQSHSDSFGDTKPMKTFIEACRRRGVKPVYCGWGSVTCQSPEYMVELVTRALMMSNQSGIVLSGWAKLSMATLQQATKDEALIAYAREYILFVESAPHEWLFPQVACTVHHGGAGTLASAMRAGVPTIVTPVWLDQWDHSYLVNELGVGIGLSKQFQQTTAQDLGDAIKTVLEDKSMAAQCKEMSAKLLVEDGVQNLVKGIEKWWTDWVQTGKHSADTERFLQEAQDSPKGFGSFFTCCKMTKSVPNTHAEELEVARGT